MSATPLGPAGLIEEAGRPPRVGLGLVGRGLLGGVLVMLLVAGAVSAAVFLKVDQLKQIVDQTPAAPFQPQVIDPPKPGEPQTLLVVGTDRRYGAAKDDARSDTMMLIRLDPRNDATAVLNVPRDLVVDIPDHGREKINAAYSFGGLNLTVRTVKAALGLPKISHAIAVDFKGFRDVVNSLGCVYTDVDRRYYHSNLGLPPVAQYAEIDQQPGYQQLCGQRALDYVRYRHGDSDFVRAARQQGFLRDAKDQVGTSALVKKSDDLLDIFGRNAQTDPNLHERKQIVRLIEQAVLSADHPVRQIAFPGDVVDDPGGLGSYVVATDDAIARTRQAFLTATKAPTQPKTTPRGPRKPTASVQQLAAGTRPEDFDLVDATTEGRSLMRAFQAKPRGTVHFPLYFPTALTRKGQFTPDDRDGADLAPNPRGYTLRDRAGKLHEAYRVVVAEDEAAGDYYGIQGTTWKTPPLLSGTSRGLTMRGREYRLFYDGRKLRIVAWRTPRAVYWVSNSLGMALSSRQMLGIARSLSLLAPRRRGAP